MSRPAGGPARVDNWLRRLRILPREPRPESLGHELRVNLFWVLGFSLLVLTLEHFGWLTWLENSALDRALRATRPRRSERVYIVEINDKDYQTVFGGRSPLDPVALKDVLARIALAGPAVIGVDVDTSDPSFRRPGWPQAVWSRDAEPVCSGRVDPHCPEADRFLRLPVLGGLAAESVSKAGVIETDPRSGVVLLPRDRDGVVRRYQRSFDSDAADPPSPLKGRVDSFPRAIIRAFREGLPGKAAEEAADAEPEGEHLILNFTGDRYDFPRISLGVLLQGAARPYWSEKSPLRGRIVLLGGTYRAARDDYFTPVGPRAGVEVVAQAVESDLSGGGIRPFNHAIAFTLDVVAGFLLVVLNWRVRSRFLFAIDFLFIAAVSLAGSYLSFRAFGHWFNFTAVLVGVLFHLLWERNKHVRETIHTLEHEAHRIGREFDEYRSRFGPSPEPIRDPQADPS